MSGLLSVNFGGALGFSLVPNPPEEGVNKFSGADKSACESARDAYFSANPDQLTTYDANTQKMIMLVYGSQQYFQNRNGGVWVQTFSASVGAIDFGAHSVTELSDVTSAGSGAIITTSERTDIANAKSSLADLTNVDNTSDADKPVSTAQQTALDAKENAITAGTASQYYRGDKTFQTLNKNAVGLSNVDNTADANKPVSTAQQTALDNKQDSIPEGTASQYYRGDKTFQTLNKSAVGLGSVDNTSDTNKPVSTAQQTALDAKQDTLVSGTNIKTVNNQSILGSGNVNIGGDDSRVDWILEETYSSPVIVYGNANVQVNSSGTIPVYLTGGDSAVSYAVTTGSLPSEFTLNTETGVISYTTTASTSSGSFGVTATNPAGDSTEATVNWSIAQANGREEFTNSESIYPFMRITTSNSIDSQILLKQSFYGRTTSTSNGTIIADSAYPIYAADNGNGTWNYLIQPTGHSYWWLFVNSTTDPANLANGYVSDLTWSLTYDLVCVTSEDVMIDSVNYPSDQTDVHYGTGLKYLSLGNDSSLDGFMSDDNIWSYGFRLVDDIPEDGLGRVMFTREGRNWLGFYIGHNSTYTNMLFGNGSTRFYQGESTFPSGGFSAGDYIRVTKSSSGRVALYRNGTLIFDISSISSFWDSATSTDTLNVLFGKGVESNAIPTSSTYYHGRWQGVFDRLWIANGYTITSDDDGSTYPTNTTHAWNMTETSGNSFSANIGSVTITGEGD